MKNILLPAFALCCALNVNAADAPLWMRYPSLSPDGKTIAFYRSGKWRESNSVNNPSEARYASDMVARRAEDSLRLRPCGKF